MPPSVTATVELALGIPFMRYDLANGRNASRRRGQLLPGCAVALRVGGRISDRLLPNVAVADDNLHDNDSIEAPAEHPWTEYETPALGEWVTSKAG